MNKFRIALLTFVVLICSANANAQWGETYVTGYLGLGTQGKYSSGAAGLNIGWFNTDNISTELDYQWIDAMATTADIQSEDGMNVMPMQAMSLKLKAHTGPDYPVNMFLGASVGWSWFGYKARDNYSYGYNNYYDYGYNDYGYGSSGYDYRPSSFVVGGHIGFDFNFSDTTALNIEGNAMYVFGHHQAKLPGFFATITVGLKFRMD